ncbi:MAG: hypothetical protein ACYDA2_02600 [Acidimicrobiales bacterium]
MIRFRRRPSARAAVVLVGFPALVFGVPAAFGLPWLVGDNLIQNYPLRALVGTDLSHGHLPLWDPYVWSGTPLLAGFNAGAAYPLTALFAVLPHMLAFVANQVAVDVIAALGLFTFLRLQGRSVLAASLASGAFVFGGFMAMQSEHVDVVQAAAWLTWAFVALDRLARRDDGTVRRALPWAALLGASLGLMALTGAAEPLLDGGVALGLFALWSLWRTPGRRFQVAVGTICGGILGALIGAAQLVPGSALQSQSQRSLHTYTYFTSGSMNKSLTVLGLDPLLLGGAHHYPLSYVGTYNLPEISSYIGILPLMGAVGLLARRHRRQPESRQWWIWYAIGAVGLLLAWGSFTPLGHVEYLVPLYNRQRLLVRNLLEVDLALAVLFAAWLDHFVLARREPLARGWWRKPPAELVLPLLPVVGVVGLQVVILAGGPWFPHFIHVPGYVSYANLWPLGLFLTAPSAVAVLAAWVVARGPRLAKALPRLLVGIVVADLAVFNVTAQVFPQSGTAVVGSSSTADALAAAVAAEGPGPGGEPHRVALFDPDRLYPNEVDALGQPDLTILRDLASVQGYGAVVDAAYDAATGTHEQGNVSTQALAGGTLQKLDLGVFVTVPENFVHLVTAAPGIPNSTVEAATPYPPRPRDPAAPDTGLDAPPTPTGDYLLVPPPATTVAVPAGQTRTWYFGTVLAVRSLMVPVASSAGGMHLRVGLLGPDGAAVHWLQPPGGTGGPEVRLDAAGTPEASGLVLAAVGGGGGSVTVGQAVVSTAGQGTYRVDGSLRDIVAPPTWRFAGRIGVFVVFTERAPGRAFLTGGAGTAHIVRDEPWGTETIAVTTTTPAVLVRNETFATGWQATMTGAGGGAGRALPVRAVGLVQGVSVPAGTHLVTFRYRPHRAVEGLALSVLGVAVVVVLAVSGRRAGGRRRRRPAAPR